MSSYAVVNPATGEKLDEYAEISDDALAAALGKASDAHAEWSSKTSVSERAAMIRRVGELHVERQETLGEIAVKEMGKPMEQAVGEVEFCGDIYGYYADRAEEFLKDEPIAIADAMLDDKKVAAGKLRMALPCADHRARLITDPPRDALLAAIESIRAS
jgi:succinate-semialdehyde dehydrogenase/glutarate-semialdehyde dehydrogenase